MNCLTERHKCVYLLFSIIYGSIVLGNDEQQCVDDVYKSLQKFAFLDDNPQQYFVTAFAKLNQAYFVNPTPNTNARGYFEDLVNGVRYIEDLTSSPRSFCAKYRNVTDKIACDEAIYMLFANKDLNREEEVTRILNLTEIEAFKYVYLTHIFNDLTFDKVYPQQQQTLEGNIVAPEQKTEEDEKKRQIIIKMREYFTELFSAAKIVSQISEFRTVEEYCAAATALAAPAAVDTAPAA